MKKIFNNSKFLSPNKLKNKIGEIIKENINKEKIKSFLISSLLKNLKIIMKKTYERIIITLNL